MELFRLLGKIAIENAEARKALKEVSQEGQETESKLGKVFGAIGKGAVAVGSVVAKGMVAGAGACVGLATAAVKSYADYEQLVGGVETLFGTRGAKSVEEYADLVGKSVKEVDAEFGMLQEAQSQVMQNAANAYKTCGLSANEYMETATSLAAALNQSSASQLDSANLADQAITDMSDNANKMGTSMEAIQNAYNGFSKQNYTMLDNLKLGYGGTKEEMQRLLDDAGKLETAMGRKFDINNFADVTEAIHLMQVEMGISGISYKEYQELVKSGAMSEAEAFKLLGTTAKEANFTIAGSLSQLKGSWSNLLAGMADENANVGDLMNNLVESASIALRNIIPRITQALTGISSAIAQIVPILQKEVPNLFEEALPSIIQAVVGLFDAVVGALPGIISAIQTILPQLIEGFMQIFTGVVEALIAALPLLIEGIMLLVDGLIGALPQIIEAIVAALPTLIPQLIDAVVSLIMMLVEMLPQIIQPLIDALPTIIIGIVEALVNNLPALIQGAIQLIMGIVQAIPQIIQALVDAIPTIVSLLTQAILNNLPAIIMGLIQVVTGIVVALPQIFSSLLEGVVNIFTGIWDGIKNVFSGLGEWFSNIWSSLGNVPGLAQMKEHIETVWGAIKSHISTVINAIKNVISSVWNSIKNVVSTVLNSIKNVIQTAWNAVKTIISNVMKLISSVLKGDWEGVKKAISNILNAIKSVIKSVWDGIKNTISSVLNGIKNVVSSIWDGIKSVISSALNTIKTVVSSAWNNVKSAISNILTGIINTVKGAAKNMLSAGKDLVKGIWNGINGAYDWIKGKIKKWVGNVTKFIKKLFGIKSPSTVMRDEVGKFLAEGVAVGIDENTKEVESSSEKMAKKVLEAAQKRLDDYKIYNDLALSEEVAFWDSVRKQVAEGTDARISADQKYLEAKKSLDDQILSAEETLQSELDEIAKRITDRQKELMDTYDLFGGFDFKAKEEERGYDNQDALLLNLAAQIETMEEYVEMMDGLEARIGGTALFDYLKSLDMKSGDNIQAVARMTDEQLQRYAERYDEKVALAKRMAEDDLAPETLADTQKAYETFAKTCDGLGVEINTSIADNMGKAVTSVTNSLDLIKQAFENFKVSFGGVDLSAFVAPTLTSDSVVYRINSETVGGTATEGTKASGTMSDVFASIVEQKTLMQKLIEMLAKFFPELIEAFDVDIFINGRVLAAELAPDMDAALGRISGNRERGR